MKKYLAVPFAFAALALLYSVTWLLTNVPPTQDNAAVIVMGILGAYAFGYGSAAEDEEKRLATEYMDAINQLEEIA